MYDKSEVFEDLSRTARNEGELHLIDKYVRGEKLRAWLTNSKEGQAISEQIEYMYCRALDDFATCDSSDTATLQRAKFDLTVSRRIYDVFNGIFQEADMAEKMLSED